MASIDENIDKFEQIEKSIEQLEGRDFTFYLFVSLINFQEINKTCQKAYIVRLTHLRAEHEEVSSIQTSPKKISVAGKMKNSIRRKNKGSTNESLVTQSQTLSESEGTYLLV